MAPHVRTAFLGLVLAVFCACCPRAGAQSIFSARKAAHEEDPSEPALAGDGHPAPAPEPVRVADVDLPSGRDIASLTPNECQRLLARADVAFEAVPDDAAPHVSEPMYLLSPLYGVSFGPKNGVSEHAMVDCRLAVALLAWAPALHEAGVIKVEHYSTYRPGARVRGSGKSSGHARALAIDAARFHLRDGRVLDVDLDWDDRERGGDPCPARGDESPDGQLLRKLVCRAVEHDLFQVVLTPHYDRAHQNHVHLEVVPDVDWSYVR